MNRNRSNGSYALVAILSLGIGFAAAYFLLPHSPHSSSVESTTGQASHWTCGMHPQVISEEPGTCPICHMDLVPLAVQGQESHSLDSPEVWVCPDHEFIEETESGECPIDGLTLVKRSAPPKDENPLEDSKARALVVIDPTVIQNMNVRTEAVIRSDLIQTVRTVGVLEYDPETMVSVTTKYRGFVEKVFVNYIGEKVRPGQPLFEIYSPELVQTEEEFLAALDLVRRLGEASDEARSRAFSLAEAARTRLRYWDISEEQINRLEQSGEVFRTMTVGAPTGGLVMKRLAGLEGMAVGPGMEIFHIADLRNLFVSAEIFEGQMGWVEEGTPVQISLDYFPGQVFRGKVRYLEPEISAKTRTLKAKIEVENREGKLRKGMFATVTFEPEVGNNVLNIPSEAVLRTGRRNVAVVALGAGQFLPREVTLGREADRRVEILNGLEEGDRIVTSAQFLLDSESRLQEAIQKMVSDTTESRNPEISHAH